MTQPMEPPTEPKPKDDKATWRSAVAAALPEHAYAETIGEAWKATWTSARGIWVVEYAANRSRQMVTTITGPTSQTKLTHAPADGVITILRALGAIPPEQYFLTVDQTNVAITNQTIDAIGVAARSGKEKYRRIQAYAQTEPVSLTERHLDTLRCGLAERSWYMPPTTSDGGVVQLALDIADALARERVRTERMARQRQKILNLCVVAEAAEPVLPWAVDAPTTWTLDPAAVREALMYQPTEPTTPMSRQEQILRTVLWQFEQVQTQAPDEFDAEDHAMIQLLRYAVDDPEAPWAIALLELIGGGLDDMASDEMDAAIAKWREATAPTLDMPADAAEQIDAFLADPSTGVRVERPNRRQLALVIVDEVPGVAPDEGCCQAGAIASPDPCPWHHDTPDPSTEASGVNPGEGR